MANQKPKQRGLGRGLSALMADVDMAAPGARPGAGPTPVTPPAQADVSVPIENVVPNPDQPRRTFGGDEMADLAASIREKGVIQPLIVRAHPSVEGSYEIVAGERRWRAAQLAQLHEVPVVVRSFDDLEVLEIAIIENIQRENLNPIEEALGFRQLMDKFGRTQEQMAEALGKSRSHIANLLRLINLPAEVQELVRQGALSAGHARALVTAPNPFELARQIVAKGLSVREAEKFAKGAGSSNKKTAPTTPKEKDADTLAIEGDLSATLKMRVQIEHRGQDGGFVSIRYKDLDQLDELCRLLSGG